MFYLLYENCTEQIQLLQYVAEKMNIQCQLIDLMSENIEVEIRAENLLLNSHKITAEDFFYSNMSPEFPFIPMADTGGNNRCFSDSYVAAQQKKSQAFSILSLLSRKGLLLNSFEQLNSLHSQIDLLHRLESTGLKVTRYCVTDSLECLKQNPLFGLPQLCWSSVELQSPIKRITASALPELLFAKNHHPYIFYEPQHGRQVRIWLLKGCPVLAALVYPPSCSQDNCSLETYEYILELDFFQQEASRIYEEFKLDFLEIQGVVDLDTQQLTAMGLDPLPVFTELEASGREWLAGQILSALSSVPSSLPEPQNGPRQTVFLKKMLEPLIVSS